MMNPSSPPCLCHPIASGFGMEPCLAHMGYAGTSWNNGRASSSTSSRSEAREWIAVFVAGKNVQTFDRYPIISTSFHALLSLSLEADVLLPGPVSMLWSFRLALMHLVVICQPWGHPRVQSATVIVHAIMYTSYFVLFSCTISSRPRPHDLLVAYMASSKDE